MPYLSPATLTQNEQRLILRATASHQRDHLMLSLALGTALRLAELVGLNVGDVYDSNGNPQDPRTNPGRGRERATARRRLSA